MPSVCSITQYENEPRLETFPLSAVTYVALLYISDGSLATPENVRGLVVEVIKDEDPPVQRYSEAYSDIEALASLIFDPPIVDSDPCASSEGYNVKITVPGTAFSDEGSTYQIQMTFNDINDYFLRASAWVKTTDASDWLVP